MKKTLILLLFLVLGWAGSTWFIGNETETLLKTYLQQTKNASAEMGVETHYDIKEYKKSFLISTAKTVASLNTGDPLIDTLFKDVQFNHTISHGPILFINGLPRFGTAHFHSTLDLDSLSIETKEIVTKLFADKNPITTHITFGLNDNADYKIIIPALEITEDTSKVSLKEGIQLTGIINKTTLMGTLNGTISALHIDDNGLIIKASASTLNIDMQEIVAGQMIGTSHLSTPSIEITGGTLPPISLGIELNSDTRKSGENALDSDITLVASDIKTPIDISKVALSTSIKAIQIKGLEQLSAVQKELQQLQSDAIGGKMDDQQQEALLEKMQNLPNIMFAAVQNTLKKDKTNVTIKADITSKQGNSHVDITARYIGNGTDMNLEKLLAGGLDTVLKTINGNINFTAPKTMVASTPAALFLPMLVKQKVITENTDNYSLHALFKSDAITLNDKAMTTAEFSTLLGLLGLNKTDDELPADLELPEGSGVPISAIPPQLLEELSKQSPKELEAQGVPIEIIEQIKAMTAEETIK